MTSPRPAGENESGDPVAASVAAYSAHADEYETTHAPKMLDRFTRFAGALPTPAVVLDAGCGPGRDLARFVEHGHIAHGIDLNPIFVAKANAYAPTLQCDLRAVAAQFPAGMFDGIWAAASLVHLGEPDAAHVLVQFASLLRPGGKLFACVKCAGETGWLDEPDGRRWYTVWDADAFAGAVADAGFVVDAVDRTSFVEVWATRVP
jgi:SAM-dependent methyltransferase